MVKVLNKKTAGKGPKKPGTVEDAKKHLAVFLSKNPLASLGTETVGDVERVVVKTPWGDDSLILVVPNGTNKLTDALNNVFLPERYSALWHRDSRDLEILWTAFPLSSVRADVKNRKFDFKLMGQAHRCDFSRASERALEIAKSHIPIAQSFTAFRNLPSFAIYLAEDPKPTGAEPLSFWIRNLVWDDDKILSLVNHLNFYLSYYDTRSPTILTHTPKAEIKAAQPQTRYAEGKFPKNISGNEIDS